MGLFGRILGSGFSPIWKIVGKEGMGQALFMAKFLCTLHVINTHICTPTLVYGPSMLPTINLNGDLVLAERISVRFGLVTRGNIVLIRSPENPRKVVTKRVTGIEGDRVLTDPINILESDMVVVPKGHVWVQGDNVYASNDSRKFGPVPFALIQGKVFWRFWPVSGFGPLEKNIN